LAASLAAIHLTKELERVEAMEAEMRRIRAEREKRDAEAKAKADEERRQREAALKAEEERRQREATLKAEEERRQREAGSKADEERRRREAESRDREALKALIEGSAPTGARPALKAPPDIISPSR
jgi:hypothetical protein